MGNPFNSQWMRLVNQMSGSVMPHFLSQLGPDASSVESGFGDFIGKYLSGAIAPLSMSGAAGAIGSLGDRMSSAQSKLAPFGEQFDLNTPEGRAQAMAMAQQKGNVSPLEASLMGAYSEPEEQMKLFLGAYMPSLGPTLTAGLGKAYGPMSQAWEDGLGAIAGGPGGSYTTLLNMLTGRPGSPMPEAGSMRTGPSFSGQTFNPPRSADIPTSQSTVGMPPQQTPPADIIAQALQGQMPPQMMQQGPMSQWEQLWKILTPFGDVRR